MREWKGRDGIEDEKEEEKMREEEMVFVMEGEYERVKG